MSHDPTEPRIPPGGRDELGWFNWTLLRVASLRFRGATPNVMLTLGRHRSMFRPWLWFASRLMPYGKIPGVEGELVILRVAARCDSEYERQQHTAIAKQAGLGTAMIDWTAEPVGSTTPAPDGERIDASRAAMLVGAVDELLDTHDLSDETWGALAETYDATQMIEFCMLVGQYAMLAGALNAMRVPLDQQTGLHHLR